MFALRAFCESASVAEGTPVCRLPAQEMRIDKYRQHARKSPVMTRVRRNLPLQTLRLLGIESQLEIPHFHNKLRVFPIFT
jgi:hypothetical protein